MYPDRTIATFNRAFRELRSEIDLSRLALGGINMWPLVRLAAFYRHEVLCDQVDAPPRTPASSQTADARPTKTETGPLSVQSEDRGGAVLFGNAPAAASGIVLLQSHRDVAEMSQSERGTFFANVASAAEDIPVAALTPFAPGISGNLPPRCWLYGLRPQLWQKTDDFAAWRSAVAEISVAFNRRICGEVLQPAHVVACALRLFSLLPGCRDVIAAFGPRMLLTNGAFSLDKMAMIVAAKEAGALIVDHQHGVFTASSETFVSPLRDGDDGVDPSPEAVWVWSDWFAANYAGNPETLPRIVGGSLIGHAVQPVPTRGRTASERTVLYLHQGPTSAYNPSSVPTIPDAILQTMQACPANWRWLIRMHPRWRSAAAQVETALRAAVAPERAGNVLVQRPSESTLADCFADADAVCTGFSASACAAHDAGLPVVLHDPVGRELFDRAIDEGRLSYAEQPADIVTMLTRGERRPPAPYFTMQDPDLARKAMRRLWQVAQASQPRSVRELLAQDGERHGV